MDPNNTNTTSNPNTPPQQPPAIPAPSLLPKEFSPNINFKYVITGILVILVLSSSGYFLANKYKKNNLPAPTAVISPLPSKNPSPTIQSASPSSTIKQL